MNFVLSLILLAAIIAGAVYLNFALVLVILTAVSGLIYLLDVIFWAPKRKGSAKEMPAIIEYSRSFFSIFLIVLILRSFIIEPFRIPSGSLEPTLQIGDFLAVNKFSYGIRLPVVEKKIFDTWHPKTGEIVVFRWPPNPTFDYVKRVIGVPGDKIEYKNKVLTINGKEMPQTFIEYTTDESSGKAVSKYQENLNGVIHNIYINKDRPSQDFSITVPPNQYFMMGDNRDDSADSRLWGFVSDEYLRGRAFIVWMSWDGLKDKIRWSKVGQIIH